MKKPGHGIYFDWAGASPVRRQLKRIMVRTAAEGCLNPEAAHPAGLRSRELMERSASLLSRAVLGRETPAVWAGSGTELFGLIAAARRLGMISRSAFISAFEHPACRANLAASGECAELPPEELPGKLRGGRPVVVISHVQSVLGWLLPLEKIIREIRGRCPDALIFADTVQSAGKFDLPEGAGFYAVSAAKLGSPAGCAAWLAATPAARELLAGFGRLRHEHYVTGRDNPFAAMLVAEAADLQRRFREADRRNVRRINQYLRREWHGRTAPNGRIIRATVPAEEASEWILHLFLPGYQSAVLLRMLAADGVSVSAGSACQAETREPDRAMRAWGFRRKDAFSGLRLSFGFASTMAEARKFSELLKNYLINY